MKRVLNNQFRPYVLILALIVMAGVPGRTYAVRNIKLGDPMPTFFLPRADSVPGMYTYENLAGQPAVIVFFRPNHEFSLDAIRDLEEIVREIGTNKFKIVAVDAKLSTAQDIRTYFADEAVSFPILLDPNRILYEKVGLIVCPTALIFDEKGILRFVIASHPRQFRQTIRANLRYLLGEIDEETMNREMNSGALKIESDLVAAWRMYNLGLQLKDEEKTDEAVSTFEKTIAKYPALVEARCELGFLKFAEGEPNVALEQFRSALAQKPGFTRARLGLAIILARTSEQQQAEEILLSILGDESLAPRTRYELGRIYLARGERDKALKFFEDALATIFPEPRSPARTQ